ncbi:MAG: EamA family transporter RarD [Thermodesulfobacteriota bacterium]
MPNDKKTGFLLAGAAFVFWGLTPVYFKALSNVSASETVAHRIIWSTLILALLLLIINRKFLGEVLHLFKKHGWVLGSSALLLSINWLTYIYAVVSGRVLEASLGYFINPLVNVALAAVFLRERLTRIQKIAVLLAAVAVTQEIFRFGQFPTLALIMAGTFGVYGLIRKKADIGGSEGLLIETLILLPLAAGYLFYLNQQDRLAFVHQGVWISCLLFSAGLVTTLPLIWFISATKKLNYSIIGMMQYIAPTLMGILGYWIYEEGFPPGRLITFSLVWFGLVMVLFESFGRMRSRKY